VTTLAESPEDARRMLGMMWAIRPFDARYRTQEPPPTEPGPHRPDDAERGSEGGDRHADASEVDLDRLAVNSVRVLAMDAIQKAGAAIRARPWRWPPGRLCVVDPVPVVRPGRPGVVRPGLVRALDRPRVVLQCAVLHLTGYPLAVRDLKQQRQWGSQTPGHPEYGHTVTRRSWLPYTAPTAAPSAV
jgi:Transketolase, thiamine diphosphate binding domain